MNILRDGEIPELRSKYAWTFVTPKTKWRSMIGSLGQVRRIPYGQLKSEIHIKQINFIGTDKKWHKMEESFNFGRTWLRLKKHLGYDDILPMEFVLGKIANGVKVYLPAWTGQKVPVLVNADATYYPDPSVESTSVDGYAIEETDNAWATIRGDVGDAANDNTTATQICEIRTVADGSEWERFRRGLILFDASASNGNTIASVDLKIYVYALYDNYTDSVSLVSSAPATDTAVVAGDYNSLGTTKYATDWLMSEITDDAYNTFSLNATGITFVQTAVDGDGIVKFGVRNTSDNDNSEPTKQSNKQSEVYIRFADYADLTYDPKLELTYEAAGGGAIMTTNKGYW